LVLQGPLLAGERKVLYLQPMGPRLAGKDVALVKKALQVFFDFPLKDLERVALPAKAYYKPRKRYRAEKLLDFLEERAPEDAYRMLGLTGVDISTTKGKIHDWGILGLASIDGVAGVISMFRCRKGARNRLHARIRLAKVAVHEVGHTLGLGHCPNRGCLMEDARGKVTTCDREYDFCARCRQKLTAWGRALPDEPEIPWPRPKR
jgi:archaemetzincin